MGSFDLRNWDACGGQEPKGSGSVRTSLIHAPKAIRSAMACLPIVGILEAGLVSDNAVLANRPSPAADAVLTKSRRLILML